MIRHDWLSDGEKLANVYRSVAIGHEKSFKFGLKEISSELFNASDDYINIAEGSVSWAVLVGHTHNKATFKPWMEEICGHDAAAMLNKRVHCGEAI